MNREADGRHLSLHPHVHCIVPSGGLRKDGQWQLPKRGNARFLYPIAAMRAVFKARFMQQLRCALEAGLLALPPHFPKSSKTYYQWKEQLYQKQWVIYAKKPFAGVKKVVQYLGRYAHRVAITNQRLLKIDQHKVHFQYKDYRRQGQKKVMALSGKEFLRRFCLHILPPHFRKVRAYGFLANAAKVKAIERARSALGQAKKKLLDRAQRKAKAKQRLFKNKQCPCCKKGNLFIIDLWLPNKDPPIWARQKHIAL